MSVYEKWFRITEMERRAIVSAIDQMLAETDGLEDVTDDALAALVDARDVLAPPDPGAVGPDDLPHDEDEARYSDEAYMQVCDQFGIPSYYVDGDEGYDGEY